MTTEVKDRVVEQKTSTIDTPQPIVVPVEKVLDDVRRDSQNDAPQYLDETVVPKGGE